MTSLDHDRAWAYSSCVQAFRLGPRLALALVSPFFVSGCGKENSTAGTPTVVLSAETEKATSSAFTAFDLASQAVDPFGAGDAKAIVFIFVRTDCPISNRYAPEIRRIGEKFARLGVRFWLVYPDADASPEAIQKHLKEYQLPREVLRDPQHGLVRLSEVRVTPEAAVFLPGRRLAYHGRIDNRYADLGQERPEATQHDLQNVLGAILQGKPAPYAAAKAVGCYISDH
jgi:hypothetical protein